MFIYFYSKRTFFIGAKQRIFEESSNLKGKKLISSFFIRSSFLFKYRKFRKNLFFLRKRFKRFWLFDRFIFNKNLWKTRFFFSRPNRFFQNFYLYKLKWYINFYKYFFYYRSKLVNNKLNDNFSKLLLIYSKFFIRNNTKGFFSYLFKSNFRLKYKFFIFFTRKVKI